ncbi:uncharacterized protein EDB91DRAFT_1252093 [Suillus paluster]|uniref:uncharacterized protein n=1 Tax=Suillus paluster TaxID=48578 RepID=UPI001B8843AF|nr:uncharacterized protein EDB91DRAFT_1252093 [Suillus paluster]KAG1731660.1 hypothetical protein EDB91DRAFT_1252093 [Suillus paluster]
MNFFTNIRVPQMIEDVKDLQNGLFVSRDIYHFMGTTLILLPIPNAYMDRDDINYLPHGDCHIMLHDLDPPPNPPPIYNIIVHNGSLFRVAPHDWPPNLPFEAVYASAMMKSWGLAAFTE